jgi:hypothetical protein
MVGMVPSSGKVSYGWMFSSLGKVAMVGIVPSSDKMAYGRSMEK